MDWINLARDIVQWWAVVNTVLNLRFAQLAGSFLTSWEDVMLHCSLRTVHRRISIPVRFVRTSQSAVQYYCYCCRLVTSFYHVAPNDAYGMEPVGSTAKPYEFLN